MPPTDACAPPRRSSPPARAGAREEEIAIRRAEVDLERARVASAQSELDKTVLRAPFDGHVTTRTVDLGETLGAGARVFEVIDLEQLEVVLDIPAHVAPRLAAGARVRIDPGDGSEAVEANVSTIIAAAEEESRNFRALVRLSADEAGALRPGTFARATAFLEPLRDVLVVPPDAVRTLRDGTVLVRAVPAAAGAETPRGAGPPAAPGALVAEWVPIRLLGVDPQGAAVEPLAGELAAGDRVVLTGVDLAFPGAALRPRASDDASAATGAAAPGEGVE